MKAAILKKYNKKCNDLKIENIEIPKVKESEVLIKIKYAAVNPLDNMIARGDVKIIIPYKMPLIMGNEFSGIVESIGKKVIGFKKGDRVYGRMPLNKIGAFAEYASVDEKALAIIPEYLSFKEAATIPLTALTALQSFELMNTKPGETIFISGGSGGTGSLGAMAIPIAKSLKLKVITNGSEENKERVLKLGADQFIDYKKENYYDLIKNVDYVLDSLGIRELEKEFEILKNGGTLVSLKGMPNGKFARRANMPRIKQMLFQLVGNKYDKMASKKDQKYEFLFVHEDGKQLEEIGKIFNKENPIITSIDEIYSLEDINKAMEKVKNGHSKGKTIIKIGD